MRYWTEINFSGHILLFEQKVELEKNHEKCRISKTTHLT